MLGQRAGWPVWVVVSAIMSCRDSTAHLGLSATLALWHWGHTSTNTRPGLGAGGQGTTRREDYHHLVMRRGGLLIIRLVLALHTDMIGSDS